MRVAIIGAGAVGSASARFLAREGHKVTVLEQFEADHDRGGSWGASRIIRKTYADPLYTGLMKSAYPLWEELERDAREPLLVRTGGLFFGPSTHPNAIAASQALADNGVAFEVLDSVEVTARFPEISLHEGEVGVFEREAGFLRASSCVRANLRLARAAGAVVLEHARVRRVSTVSDHVVVELEGGESLQFDALVVAAGAWSRALLRPFVQLPLVVTRQTYCHFRPQTSDHTFSEGRFPVWIDLQRNFYGFPASLEPAGVKVALHARGEAIDVDRVDRAVRAADRAPLVDYCRQRLPGLSADVLFEKVCLYTNSPDEDFIVDRVPNDPRIVVFAGDSGHAFKFSVLLGRILALMACQKDVSWDLSRFAVSRFSSMPS